MASEYLEVDPHELLVIKNVRLDRRTDKDFVASIKEHGVLQPIIGYRDDEGRIVVRYGTQRTLGAIEAGRPSVPVLVGESPDEVERIATQVTENEARRALTTGETAAAMQQLCAFGLTAEEIARKTGAKRQKVTTALVVAGSELATTAADRYQLTLEQAAAVAEFESDSESVKTLVAATRAGQFDHVVQRLRDDRAETEAVEAARVELAAAGVRVIDRAEFRWPGQRLDNMRIGEEQHRGCPGHAAILGSRFAATGRVPSVVYVCADAVAHGHLDETARPAEQEKRPMTDEQKAERKRVIRLNKEWASATVVRREFLIGFAKRKTAPDGGELFVLTALLCGDHEIKQAMETHWPMLRTAIGVRPADADTPDWLAGGKECASLIDTLASAPAKRVLVVLIAAVLTAWEAKTGPHTWRQQSAQTTRYLTQLTVWGYQLSDVERIACGEDVEAERSHIDER